MRQDEIDIRVTYSGTKRCFNLQIDHALGMSWSDFLISHSIDPSRVRIICNGSLVRDASSTLYNPSLKTNALSIMLISVGNYTPSWSDSSQHTERIDIDAAAGATGEKFEQACLEQVDLIQYAGIITIESHLDESPGRTLFFSVKGQKYQMHVSQSGITLREIANRLGIAVNLNSADMIFVYKGRKFDLDLFDETVDEWSDKTNVQVMFSSIHYSGENAAVWVQMQTKALVRIEDELKVRMRLHRDDPQFYVMLRSWKDELETMITGLNIMGEFSGEVETAALRSRIVSCLQAVVGAFNSSR
jgi:hypothetical protein